MKSKSGRGTLAKEKPPIFGMIQRQGEVVLKMLPNVKPTTIAPLIQGSIGAGTLIYTDEYSIYSRLSKWGYDHKSVCHGKGEYARSGRWRWILRSPCEYDGRLLVLTSVLVQTAPRHFSRKVTPVSGIL
ncbi:transposase [Synechocystis sp. PCC 7509]|uniref:transposase n=1 Tax=Synechocystis sp. PCC 7509 TaxID=927677 RepID=UPI0011DC9A93